MPAPSKIQNETEVIRWISDGWTYQQIVDEYRRKYGIDTSLSMWSNFRRRRGLERRINRDDDLVPWAVEKHHRNNYHLAMLRAEGRRRNGFALRATDRQRLESWKRNLEEAGTVVLYDSSSPEGFRLVTRRADDDPFVRRPTKGLTQRRRGE